jgi:WD40 repeat protein
MQDNSGQVIKGYHLQELIGEGGFGVVYKAYQPMLEREVAIKVILPIYANQPNFIRRFEAEAQLVARLEHPHIVPLYDYWRDPNGAYLVMRWLRGGDVLESIKKGAWPLDDAARLLEQLAGALAVAHRNNIVHQDIKPANILLDEDRNVYLTDFGIAKDLTGAIKPASPDDEEVLHGSPAYISPEQINRKPVTAQTDIYSLGLVLYEILIGRKPFEAANIMELLSHQSHSQLPPLQEHRPELPTGLNQVLWRATAKNPDLRYQDTLTMADEFRRAIQQEPAIAAAAPVIAAVPIPVSRAKPAYESVTSVLQLPMDPPNPYKGLRSFQEADANDFFGREALVESLIHRLTDANEDVTDGERRFLAVVGPSGSGKSSVVKAGLIPAIRRGQIPGWADWFVVEMTPGLQPIRELQAALLKIATKADPDIFKSLHSDPHALGQAIGQLLPEAQSDLILVIDQFEEVFTLVENESDRAHFLYSLHHALIGSGSRLRLIITLRADFYDRPLMYPGFGDLMRKRTEVVLPLTPAELEKAIVAPASRAGLILDSGLPEMIIADVTKQPASLPLLQYALTELYERRNMLKLTVRAYQSIDGVAGALARRADQIYIQLDAPRQEAARQLFLRLVALGEGTEDTRRRAQQSELNSLEGDTALMREVIGVFGKFRLLTFDHDPSTRVPTVEIAHEALIRNWGRLREWLNASRDDLRAHRRLSNAAAEWARAGRDRSYLATGARLAQFESLLNSTSTIALNQEERDYVRASVAQRQRGVNRLRAVAASLAILSLLALMLAGFAFQQRDRASAARATAIGERDRADVEASISRSRELAASALVTLDQVDLPLLLSLEALDVADTFEARNSLLSGLLAQPRLETFLNGHTDNVRAVAYRPDGAQIASAGRDNTIRLWDGATPAPGAILEGHTDWINALAYSPDGSILASSSEDGTIRLWDTSQGQAIGEPLAGHEGEVWSVSFSPDGSILASGGADGTIRLWDVENGQPLRDPLSGHDDIVYALVFRPGETGEPGYLLASGSADNSVRLWQINGEEVTTAAFTGHSNWVLTAAFHPTQPLLATGGADNTIRLWNTSTGEDLLVIRAHGDWVRALDFDPGGRVLVSGSSDGSLRFWSLQTGQLIDALLNVNLNEVWSVKYSPDARRLISGGGDSAVLVWDLQARSPLARVLAGHDQQVLAVAFSPDGSRIASAGDDLAIRLWNPADGAITATLEGHTAFVTAVAFSADGTRLASASTDQTVIIWDTATGASLGNIEFGDGLFALDFVPGDGLTIAVGDNDGQLILWDVAGVRESWMSVSEPLAAHEDRITALAVDRSGSRIATGSRDGSIRLWDVSSRQPTGDPLLGHANGVLGLAFSPDGTRLASGSRDTTIRLWDASTGASVGDPLAAHTNWVMGVAFSPDGRTLASVSGDQTVLLWDLVSIRPIGRPLEGHTDWVNALDFNADGSLLVTGGRDASVIVWTTGLDTWREQACQIANRNLNEEELSTYFSAAADPVMSCPAQVNDPGE